MGTSYHITVVGDVDSPESLQGGVDALLRDINQSMSTYIADSEINRLSRQPVGEAMRVTEPLLDVLLLSRKVSELSGGAFDVTVRPLIDLWGFGPDFHEDQIPARETIVALQQRLGYQYLDIDPEAATVTRLRDVMVDLSAVAKGYAADRVADYLQQQGHDNILVEIGGEMALRGHNTRKQPWRIAVERPQAGMSGEVYEALSVTGAGVATSGDYRNYFEIDGVRYSHTLDPVSGYPVRHQLASVTVVSELCGEADALATALTVLGVERGYALAESAGIAALFIVREGEGYKTVMTERMKPYL